MYISPRKDRCVILGTYIAETHATVRATATRYGVSKSTVHKDVTEVLRHHDPALYERVKAILDENKSERHLRGGEATRQRYHRRREPDAGASDAVKL